MRKLFPLLLAVAVGATSGLLGAWWPGGAPPSAAAPPVDLAAPSALIEADVPDLAKHPASPRPPARLELSVFCNKAPIKSEVSYRRFEQSSLMRRWGGPSKPLSTDAQGQAVLPLTAGIYLLTARATGCAPLHHSFEVKEGVSQQSIELLLGLAHAISGTVRDATNQQPVGGALITVRQQLRMRSETKELSANDDAWTSVGDSLGRYRVEGVGDGEFVVRASAEGFADAKATLKLDSADGKTDLALEPNGFIEGSVRPMTGAATVKDLRDDARTVFVNADGSFRLAVGPGDHLLLGEDASGATGMVRVNVPVRGTVRNVELKLERGGKIRGTAALGGAPAVCARVWIRAESDPYEIASAQVAADGTFTLERVPAGRYWLFGECADGEHGDVLGVEPNKPEPVELTLKQAAGLVVQVIDSAGRPVVGAEVEVSQPSREPIAAVTDALGHAELSKLVMAVVEVEARSGTREGVSKRVPLLEGQAVSVVITLGETGLIVGRIDAPAGLVQGINAFSREVGFGNREKVGADGAFKVRVLPGHYKVFPWLKDYNGLNHVKEVDVEANKETRIDFVVASAPKEQLGIEASTPGTIGASFDDGPGGVTISWVISGSPVDRAGLKQGDLLLAIDGTPLQRSLDAFSRTRGQPGSTVRITYRRGGSDAEVVVTRAGGSEL